jgi:ribonuclease H / adenosylcobalamin/alpha-ribazole phosphatase
MASVAEQAGGAEAQAAPAGASQGAASGWGPPRGRGTRTLLLRHGQTELSVERRFAGRGDIELTKAGRAQAAAVAARLAASGGIDLIVSSPLRRARHTAEAVAEATGAPIAVDENLVETDFGAWEGLTFAEVAERWPDAMNAWLASAEVAPPGGESFTAVARRAVDTVERLVERHQGRKLVLVSHVTPIKTLLCRALLAPPAAMYRMHLDTASLCEIEWFGDGPAVVRSMNDVSHLLGADTTAKGKRRGKRDRAGTPS